MKFFLNNMEPSEFRQKMEALKDEFENIPNLFVVIDELGVIGEERYSIRKRAGWSEKDAITSRNLYYEAQYEMFRSTLVARKKFDPSNAPESRVVELE